MPDKSRLSVQCAAGDNLLELAHEHDLELEGACECSCACSTCHLWVDDAYFEKLPEATEEEEDMLDMAFGLRANSRLGCQIKMTEELDGIIVEIPPFTRNMYVDGSKPAKH